MQPSGSRNESAWSMPVSGSFHDRIVSCCRWSTSSLCTLALTKLLPSASLIKHDEYICGLDLLRTQQMGHTCVRSTALERGKAGSERHAR